MKSVLSVEGSATSPSTETGAAQQTPRVLVIDDEPAIRQLIATALSRQGITSAGAASHAEAIQQLDRQPYDLILLDVRLGEDDGMTLLRHIIERDRHAFVIVITGYASMENAVQAMRLGAYDYLVKPFELPELLSAVNRALDRRQLMTENLDLHDDLARSYRIEGVVGRSPKMREVYRIASIVAPTDATVLIRGETGTGKELLARSLHLQSRRSNGPLVVMNCGAVPESLLETEVFGHDKGAFTGAVAARAGKFERAEGGTIFLDEIGDMSPPTQVKLLRTLQERVVERVGGTRPIQVDCRIIAATHQDLYQMVKRGEFREDLYYRLSVVPLEIPPLRERMEDLPLLVRYFLSKFRKELGKAVRDLSPQAMRRLHRHSWPGNIRELESCLKRAVILAQDAIITAEDIWLREVDAGERPGLGVSDLHLTL